MSGEIFVSDLDSLHFISAKDFLQANCTNHKEFENPTVIEHEWGHRPVKTLSKENLDIVASFILK